MKKVLVIAGIVTSMVIGLAAVATAQTIDTDWAVQLRAMNGTASQGSITLGTKTGAGDGFITAGSEDATFASPTAGYGEISCTLGSTTRINKDYRAPMKDGDTKIWDLVLGINGGAPGTVKLIGWMPATFLNAADSRVNVKLMQGNTVLWTFAKGVSGSSALPNYTGTFAFDGNPINLQLVATVPEPGSMLAMLSGLVGLVGYGVRRRK